MSFQFFSYQSYFHDIFLKSYIFDVTDYLVYVIFEIPLGLRPKIVFSNPGKAKGKNRFDSWESVFTFSLPRMHFTACTWIFPKIRRIVWKGLALPLRLGLLSTPLEPSPGGKEKTCDPFYHSSCLALQSTIVEMSYVVNPEQLGVSILCRFPLCNS